jgi:MFS family permease
VNQTRAAEAEEVLTAPATGPAATSASAVALPLRISLVILFFTYWCVDIVSPALPAIQESLALSATGTGLVFSVFFAGRLLANLPAAWFAERNGPKWTAVVGAAVLLVGSLLAAIASSPATLLSARVIQGIAVATLATAGLLSVLRARPGRGAAMTAFNVATGAGGSGGLLIGGYLTTEIGWRAIFWLSALLGAVLLMISILGRAESRLASPVEPERDEPGSGIRPSRAAEAAAIGANFLVYINYAIWIVLLPLLGTQKYGFDAGQVGMLLLFVNVFHFASAVPVGVYIRKAGASRALATGLGISGLSMLLVPFAPSAPWLLLPLLLYGVGQMAGNSSGGDLILRLGGGGGRAVGAVRLSSDIGLVAGPAAAGMLADAAGVEAPFFVLGAVALMAMGMSIVVRWPRRWPRSRARD